MQRGTRGVSLAKGPIAISGIVMLAYGVTGLIFGGQSFTTHAMSGTVQGEKWLGLELNGWSSLLFIIGGGLLLSAASMHWSAKGMAMLVGLGFAAAGVIAFIDGSDVFGIFAANALTATVWCAVGAWLILLSMLGRVGATSRDERMPAETGTRRGRFTRRDTPVRDEEPSSSRGPMSPAH